MLPRAAPGCPGGGARLDAQGLVQACQTLQRQVTQLEEGLPFVKPPTLDEVHASLHSGDLQRGHLPQPDGGRVGIAYIHTLTDERRLWHEVILPLVSGALPPPALPRAAPIQNWHALVHHLLQGGVVLLPETGPPLGLDMAGLQQRSVGEPTTERQVIGPKEGFVERLDTNVGLVRNRLRDPALRIAYHTVGRRSRTRVAMLYLQDVADPQLVQRASAGLHSIAVDFIRTAMDVAELTFQHSWSVFPLIEQTERPDRVAHGLSQGRLALVVDGAPFALLVPVTLFDFQHDGEGALPGPAVTAFVRLQRLGGLFLALALPGLYVALLAADPLVLPIPLTITLAAARFAVPYPVATEAVLMLFAADILAEATAQSASAIGNALSVVGTLIVGQLMVQAHLASTLLMIVVAASVMGSFLTLKFTLSYALRMWKYALVLLAAVGGILGWFTGLCVLLVHLASLESAGTPFLAPLAAARGPAAVARAIVQPGRSRERLRPAEYRPRQRVRARPWGRR